MVSGVGRRAAQPSSLQESMSDVTNDAIFCSKQILVWEKLPQCVALRELFFASNAWGLWHAGRQCFLDTWHAMTSFGYVSTDDALNGTYIGGGAMSGRTPSTIRLT